MRHVVLAVLLVTAALGGCLDQAGDLAPTAGDDTPDRSRSDPQGNETDGSRSGNGSSSDDGSSGEGEAGNETGDEDDGDGNETGEDGSDEADPGWPDVGEADVRPGVAGIDGICTLNFVFSSPDNETLYVGTAAHCVEDVEPGQQVSLADGAALGTLVYSSFRAMDRANESSELALRYNDFALVAVDPDFRGTVHPATRAYGGPTGLVPDAGLGDRVLTVGETNARDGADELDPREGVVVGSSEWHVDVYLYAPSIPGDSGSPVITANGKALGVLVTLEFLPGPGSNDATKVSRAVEYMEAHGGPQVELEGWAQFSEGRLPR